MIAVQHQDAEVGIGGYRQCQSPCPLLILSVRQIRLQSQEESFTQLDIGAIQCVNRLVWVHAMGAQLPTTLGKSPLLEALFEIRFQASRPAAGDLLPGILFSALQGQYPDVISLPLARVPRDLRENDVNFLYQPSHQLVGKNSSIQIGDRVLALAVQIYPGWSEFKMQAEQLVGSGEKTGLIENVERYSFRYINVIPVQEGQPQLQSLNAKIELGEAPVL